MEDNENVVTTTETVEQVETPEVKEEKKEKTFTRDEVNKIINAEKQKEREIVLKEIEAKKAEADKLAKMDEDTKKSYELEQEKARANKAENELNAYRLKDETVKQANERNIALGYIETIDFTKETAESIATKLDIFEKVSKAEKAKAISEYSKEPTPKTGDDVKSEKSNSGYEEFLKKYERK